MLAELCPEMTDNERLEIALVMLLDEFNERRHLCERIKHWPELDAVFFSNLNKTCFSPSPQIFCLIQKAAKTPVCSNPIHASAEIGFFYPSFFCND